MKTKRYRGGPFAGQKRLLNTVRRGMPTPAEEATRRRKEADRKRWAAADRVQEERRQEEQRLRSEEAKEQASEQASQEESNRADEAKKRQREKRLEHDRGIAADAVANARKQARISENHVKAANARADAVKRTRDPQAPPVEKNLNAHQGLPGQVTQAIAHSGTTHPSATTVSPVAHVDSQSVQLQLGRIDHGVRTPSRVRVFKTSASVGEDPAVLVMQGLPFDSSHWMGTLADDPYHYGRPSIVPIGSFVPTRIDAYGGY